MKRSKGRSVIILGIVVVVLLAGSIWYSINFNDWRLVEPMEGYTFQVRDLPMLASITLLTLYCFYLLALIVGGIFANKRRQEVSKTTRKLDPRLGLLGFLGFLGLAGFWTYSVDKSIFPFIFFAFFGFFGFFYEGKMSDTLMDERYEEDRMRAQLMAGKVAFAVICLALFVVSRGALLGSLEYTLIAVVILISLAVALYMFLSEYLLYRYDRAGQPGSDEEG